MTPDHRQAISILYFDFGLKPKEIVADFNEKGESILLEQVEQYLRAERDIVAVENQSLADVSLIATMVRRGINAHEALAAELVDRGICRSMDEADCKIYDAAIAGEIKLQLRRTGDFYICL